MFCERRCRPHVHRQTNLHPRPGYRTGRIPGFEKQYSLNLSPAFKQEFFKVLIVSMLPLIMSQHTKQMFMSLGSTTIVNNKHNMHTLWVIASASKDNISLPAD